MRSGLSSIIALAGIEPRGGVVVEHRRAGLGRLCRRGGEMADFGGHSLAVFGEKNAGYRLALAEADHDPVKSGLDEFALDAAQIVDLRCRLRLGQIATFVSGRLVTQLSRPPTDLSVENERRCSRDPDLGNVCCA